VFTFSVEGVSRSLTHQLVRHRIASYSQQSQRYVSLNTPDYVVPEEIAKNPEAKKLYDDLMQNIWDTYNKLEDLGIIAEDARYVLPNACTTNITLTMNARQLMHFFTLRCCNRAQTEIRQLADEMLKLCKEACPNIFAYGGPSCVRGPCPEGEKCCGHSRRAEFIGVKEE
jgi:thymidylate synthase (FAD)